MSEKTSVEPVRRSGSKPKTSVELWWKLKSTPTVNKYDSDDLLLSQYKFRIHANGLDGVLQFFTVCSIDMTLDHGTVFGDPVSNITVNGAWISFTRTNPGFTENYSGAVILCTDANGHRAIMLAGIFTHIENGDLTGPYFWCTDFE